MLEGCTPFPVEFAERYVREGIWQRETIPQAIANAALEHPESIAVTDSTRSLTYSQLLAEAGSLAALLSPPGNERHKLAKLACRVTGEEPRKLQSTNRSVPVAGQRNHLRDFIAFFAPARSVQSRISGVGCLGWTISGFQAVYLL